MGRRRSRAGRKERRPPVPERTGTSTSKSISQVLGGIRIDGSIPGLYLVVERRRRWGRQRELLPDRKLL